MASVHDVAAFILGELGQMGTMKLQKLVYYAQAWSIVWDEHPLFSEGVEAWDKGPVVRELYREHRGVPTIAALDRGDPSALSPDQKATIAAVLAFYGTCDEWWLSELSHRESPWLDAREAGTPNPIISHAAMQAFFSRYPASFRAIPESVSRGLHLVVALPPNIASDVLHGEAIKIEGLEEWLETGEGDPWQATGG